MIFIREKLQLMKREKLKANMEGWVDVKHLELKS